MYRADCVQDGLWILLDQLPVVRAEDDKAEPTTREILLVGEVLVSRHHDVEVHLLGSAKEMAVGQLGQAHLPSG